MRLSLLPISSNLSVFRFIEVQMPPPPPPQGTPEKHGLSQLVTCKSGASERIVSLDEESQQMSSDLAASVPSNVSLVTRGWMVRQNRR